MSNDSSPDYGMPDALYTDVKTLGIETNREKRGREMRTDFGKFTFEVPSGHPRAGEKITGSFEYKIVDNDTEANAVIAEKKWSLVALVNDNLKQNARSNAYQSALLPFKPTEVPQEDIVERMVRDYIRLGASEEVARRQVSGVLASIKG
jgi:hypothetical protein